MKKTLLLSVALLIIGAVLFVGLKSKSEDVIGGGSEYLVLKVIDGDTIEVEKLGKVRYIGIDTPETKHPSRGPEPYGREAYEANKRLVEGKTIRVELDVAERDKYGRMLAYIYLGDLFVNAWLVEQGYARVMTYPPNVKYADLFLKLERKARESAQGLWGIPAEERIEPGQGYWGSSRSDKYHKPKCRWAQKIGPQNLIIFKNREEALKAGYKPCRECGP